MKVEFFTLGCKVNTYETEAMKALFIDRGYEVIDNDKKNSKEKKEISDIYVINTCSVTNIAEKKSRQYIRRAKELNPKAIIVACGCYAQVAKNDIEKINGVDIILGNNEKTNIVDIIEKYIGKKETIVSDVMHQNDYLDFKNTEITKLNRADVKVQDGCDRFCSYCIIPYARGKVRSREPESILKEIKDLVGKGIKEIVVTGIHLASYGKDFNDEKGKEYREKYGYEEEYKKFDAKDDLHSGSFRLIELLEQINKIEGLERIRLGSIEPKLINDQFISRLKNVNKICHHFHLSLQSGNNKTLKDMNRRYNIEEFEDVVNILRKTYKDVILTTDIIVGFPGETDEDFEKTYKYLEKIKLYKMHIFKYSPKKGTIAEKMPMQIDGNIKEIRSNKLIELSNKNQLEYNKMYIGKDVFVLIEEKEKNMYKGHTDNYLLVNIEDENKSNDKTIINKIVKVRITDIYNNLELKGIIE